jgi:hypothetical protein
MSGLFGRRRLRQKAPGIPLQARSEPPMVIGGVTVTDTDTEDDYLAGLIVGPRDRTIS